jgi:hypothetical protein
MQQPTGSLLQKSFFTPKLWLLKRALDRIPWLPISLDIYYFFSYTGSPPQKIRHRFAGTIREADINDLDGIVTCSGRNKRALFKQRFASEERCVIAITKDGAIAGYGWASTKSQHQEDKTKCTFEIPQGMIYIYDWFIQPNYRLTGLWVGFIHFLMSDEIYDPNRGIFGFISHGNDASLKAHIKFGFKAYKRKIILTIAGKIFVIDRSFDDKETDKPLRPLHF